MKDDSVNNHRNHKMFSDIKVGLAILNQNRDTTSSLPSVGTLRNGERRNVAMFWHVLESHY